MELFLRFKTEKEKYPEWFQKQYINHHESSITEFHQYSDEQIDQLVVSERSRREYDRSMQSLRATIDMWQLEYREIAGKVDREAAEFREDSKDVSVIHQRLLSE